MRSHCPGKGNYDLCIRITLWQEPLPVLSGVKGKCRAGSEKGTEAEAGALQREMNLSSLCHLSVLSFEALEMKVQFGHITMWSLLWAGLSAYPQGVFVWTGSQSEMTTLQRLWSTLHSHWNWPELAFLLG